MKMEGKKEFTQDDLQQLFNDLHALMWMGEGCQICAHCVIEQRAPYMKTGCKLKGDCEPLWRGLVDEEEAPGI
jgi:hypothetical protein